MKQIGSNKMTIDELLKDFKVERKEALELIVYLLGEQCSLCRYLSSGVGTDAKIARIDLEITLPLFREALSRLPPDYYAINTPACYQQDRRDENQRIANTKI